MIEISRRNIYQKGNILLTIFSLSVIFVLGSVFRPPVIFLTAPIRYHILEWGFESMILKFKRFCAIKMPCPGITSFWPKCDLLFILNAKTLQFTMILLWCLIKLRKCHENESTLSCPHPPWRQEGSLQFDENLSIWWKSLNMMKISQFDENLSIRWKSLNLMKISQYDENLSIRWKSPQFYRILY